MPILRLIKTYNERNRKTRIMNRQQVKNLMIANYKRFGNWTRVAEIYKVSPALVWRLANQEWYEPKDPGIRYRVGLDTLAPAPVCRKCGEVHVTRRCTRNIPKPASDLFSMSPAELRWRFENREELNDDSKW